ncbi:hypothetical protein ACFTWD_09270 [Streptomyces sp. NPDC056943]|uniref:hypothetical protein n=1 Tax=Streptomyces sp. NPDC056943 TaxID=3345971 RepID=UPI00363666D9
MSTNNTGLVPAIAGGANPISVQAPAAAALLALTETFDGLPAGYITMHSRGKIYVGLQLDSPDAFEAWRTALLISPEAVQLCAFEGSTWLAADAMFRGVRFHVTGYGIALTVAEAVAA